MITRDDILDCWLLEPSLVFYGFTTDADKLRSGRSDLISSLAEIQLCYDWIMQQDIGKRVTANSPNSYMLKHYVEYAARQAGVRPDYVSNGCFIAAAIIAGVPYKHCGGDSPNAHLAINHIPIKGKRYPVGPYVNGKQYRPLVLNA